jgi:hypothetical protein
LDDSLPFYKDEFRRLIQAAAELEKEDGGWHTQHEIAVKAGYDIEEGGGKMFILYMAAAGAHGLFLKRKAHRPGRLFCNEFHTRGET